MGIILHLLPGKRYNPDMTRRTLAHLLLVLILLTLLAACGQASTDSGNPGDGGFRIITATPRATAIPTATPTPVVPVLDVEEFSGVEVVLWYASDPTAPDLIASRLAWFNQENEYGITVTGRNLFYPNDLEAAVNAAIGSGQTPHVVLAEPYQYLPWAEMEEVVDLSPYLENPAYGISIEDYYPEILGRDDFFDGRWGFPGLFSGQVMLYNQTWAGELGFPAVPETTAVFQRQACAAHEANRDRTGGWIIDPSPGGATAWLLSFDPALDQLLDFKSREAEAAYTFLSELYTEGCAWYPLAAYPDEDFALRQGLFYAVDMRDIGYVAGAFDLANSGDEWTAIGYPNPQGEPVISLSGQSYVVLKSDVKTQIAAWLLIRALTGTESQTALAKSGLYLPLDRETAAELLENESLPSAWRDALALLDQGVVEPPIQQWGVLRSVLQDAQAEVLDERFVPGTMSLFLDRLDSLVDEILQ